MKMKNILLILVALSMFTVLLAACGSSSETDTAPEPTTMPTLAPAKQDDAANTGTESGEFVEGSISEALSANPWQWTSFTDPVQQFDIESPESYVLALNEDGTVNITADCNNASGSYTAGDSSLAIQIGPMTMAACPDGSRGEQFLQLLGSSALYFFEDGDLYIDLMADGGTMVFMKLDEAMLETDDGEGAFASALWTNPWQWTSFTNPVEQFDVESPESYILAFSDDGSVNITADCNSANGSYTADDSSLSVQIGSATMAACPDGSRDERFLQLLGSSALYFYEDGDLYIDLVADGGTMIFNPADAVDPESAEEITINRTDIIWQLSAIADPASGETLLDESELYTLSLGEQDVLVLASNCRAAIGSYKVDENVLTLTYDVPEITDDCQEGSSGDRFFETLQREMNYYFQDDRLYIDLMADAGSLIFDIYLVLNLDATDEYVLTTVSDLCGEGALEINDIEKSLNSDISSQLDEMLISYIDGDRNPPAPGVSLLVITPEGRYFKSTGVADVDTCEPLMADALFEIGSNTKLMTAAMIFQLQEEGLLSTSDPISNWLPEMAALIPFGDQMTIDMLLTHTNGIYDYLNGTAEDGPLAAGLDDKQVLTQSFTPEELVQLAVASGDPYFEPGAEGQWQYSNTGYILLGMIIEAATGISYEENLQYRIFEPLGLEDTFLLLGQPEAGLLPEGYVQTPFDYTSTEWNATQAWSAGAVVSNSEEFATFLKALFTGDLFEDPETLDQMLNPAQPSYDQFSDDYYYGHGMFYKNGLLGHGGQALGYQSDVGYIPSADATIVFWSNSAENAVGRAAVPIAQLIDLVEVN